MRLYARLLKDTNEQENWVIIKEGEYSTPVTILNKYELEIFLKCIEDERKNWKRDKK